MTTDGDDENNLGAQVGQVWVRFDQMRKAEPTKCSPGSGKVVLRSALSSVRPKVGSFRPMFAPIDHMLSLFDQTCASYSFGKLWMRST